MRPPGSCEPSHIPPSVPSRRLAFAPTGWSVLLHQFVKALRPADDAHERALALIIVGGAGIECSHGPVRDIVPALIPAGIAAHDGDAGGAFAARALLQFVQHEPFDLGTALGRSFHRAMLLWR